MLRVLSTPTTNVPKMLATAFRPVSMASSMGFAAPKREGDISDAFASLAGQKEEPLPDRFRALKLSLAAGHEKKVEESWKRLLAALREETRTIIRDKATIIPEVRFSSLEQDLTKLKSEIHKRGAAVIRGVIPEAEARAYKTEVEEYVRKNPSTKGFPAHDRQVFELYWSAPQIKARAHPNLLKTQRILLEMLWEDSGGDNAAVSPLVDLSTPITYADRLRIRQPGDAFFALGPHQDGGSVERWERDGYGRGKVYDGVFAGNWDDPSSFNPWNAGARVDAVMDLYQGLGACSAFRAFQGWLSMSHSGPDKGTLLVYPGLRLATAYTLLRPFFRPVRKHTEFARGGVESEEFLRSENWVFTGGNDMTSDLQGATPGRGQEYPRAELHPHLELRKTMVHIPEVKPGDFVIWHCDTIHAVDRKHNGTSDSSVLYIPVCPLSELNAEYLLNQRNAFLEGTPGPDFPGGKGESEHVDRPTEEYVSQHADPVGLRAFGLEKFPVDRAGLRPGQRAVLERANEILGL